MRRKQWEGRMSQKVTDDNSLPFRIVMLIYGRTSGITNGKARGLSVPRLASEGPGASRESQHLLQPFKLVGTSCRPGSSLGAPSTKNGSTRKTRGMLIWKAFIVNCKEKKKRWKGQDTRMEPLILRELFRNNKKGKQAGRIPLSMKFYSDQLHLKTADLKSINSDSSLYLTHEK